VCPRPSRGWGEVEDKLREDIWEAIDNYVDAVVDMRRAQDREFSSDESVRCLGNMVHKSADEVNKFIELTIETLRKPLVP
jgi:hypothetical protein